MNKSDLFLKLYAMALSKSNGHVEPLPHHDNIEDGFTVYQDEKMAVLEYHCKDQKSCKAVHIML